MEVKRYGNEGQGHYELKRMLSEFLAKQGFHVYPEAKFPWKGPTGKRPDIVAYKPGTGTFFIEITFSRYIMIPDP